MKKIVAAINVMVSLISVCADCVAVVELFFKLYDASKEIITDFFSRRFSDIKTMFEKVKSFDTSFFNLIEKILWRKKYILI